MTGLEARSDGQKFCKDHRFAEAIPLLKLAADAFPMDLSVWRDLVFAASSVRQHDDAIEYAGRATKHHPSDGWLWMKLVEELIAIGHLDEAEEALSEREEGVQSDDPWLFRSFALLYGKRKNYTKEAEALEEIASLGEATGVDLNKLGIAYRNQGNFAKAIEYYRRSVIALSIKEPLFNMGLVFQHPDVSQNVDATDAFRWALHLSPTYDKAQEQLDGLKQKLIPLAARARQASVQLLQPNERFRFYVSPFEALNLNDVVDADSLEPKVIQRAKRALLSEIELDGSVSWLDDYQLDKARAIALVDELDDPVDCSYHFAIFQNKPLLQFLTRGEIEHFLYSDNFFPQETLELLNEDPELEEFVSKPFAQQYDLLLFRAIERFELDVVEALFDGRRWVTAADQDACFKRVDQWVANLLGEMQEKRLASESKESPINAEELDEWLSWHGIETILNLLPAHFRPAQTEFVQEIRLISVSWHNQHDDAEMARDVLAVCNRFQFKNEELKQQLEEDCETITQIIRLNAEEQFAEELSILIETVRCKRSANSKRRGMPGVEEAQGLLIRNGVETLFQRFPMEFRNDQTSLAGLTRSFAVECFNEHSDCELSLAVLKLCKRYKFENAELTEKIENDIKALNESFTASRVVTRPTLLPAEGQEGSTWFGLIVFTLVIGGVIWLIAVADSHR